VSAPPAQPVWITGLGVASPAGDSAATWRSLERGERWVRMLSPPGVQGWGELPLAPVAAPSAAQHLPDPKLHKYMSATTRLACAAAGEALGGAQLLGEGERAAARQSTGVFLATGLIAFEVDSVRRAVLASRSEEGDLDLQAMGRRGLKRTNPLMPFRMLLNMPLGMTSIVFGLRGPNQILYPDAVQAGVASAAALRALRNGRANTLLLGGCCQSVSLLPLGTALRAGHVAPSVQAALPYGSEHAGLAPGDGAGCLVLEQPTHARRRGARPLARLVGAQANCHGSESGASSGLRARQWGRLAGDLAPDLLLTTGNLDATADGEDAQAWATLWPHEAPRAASLDGHLGVAGPASVALALCVAAQALDTGALPEAICGGVAAQRPPRRVLVSATAPEAGRTSLLLEAAP